MNKLPKSSIGGQAPKYLPGSTSGQALIVILLVLAVAATVVLSLISRTVTDVAITNKEKESSRAFSAAEAGIEEALVGGPATTTLPGGETYTVAVGAVGEGATEFVWPQEILAGDTVPLWFVSHSGDGSLTCADNRCFTGASFKVCWGREGTLSGDSQTPAIEVVVIYKTSAGAYLVGRVALDPNFTRRSSNKFDAESGSCTLAGQAFPFGKTINFADLGIPSSVYDTAGGLQTARIRLLYNTATSHPVAFGGTSSFPSQGKRLTSTGTSGEATRKVEVFQGFADLPPVFDFVLFTGGSLTK